MDTPQTKNRLLLVDGDPKSLRVLDVSLKKAGFEVTTATSGHDALASLEAELPDLIISDTDLTEMDGFELCNRIKAKPEWAKIPFLFVSGRKSIEDKIRGLELGVDDYLTKPIYIKEIGVRVRTALQRAERERMESRREGRTRFAGELSDVGVVDLVQTIELNRKSGIIHIVNRDDRRGSIFFRDGKVIDAEVGRLSGAHALYRLFSWSEGQFAVEFKHIRRHDVIDLSMAAVLMEGMRRLDESAHLLEHLPSLHHVLEVDCRVLAEELAELPDEMNSVLRLCDGARSLQEVIEDSDHPDLETLGIISKLYLGQIIFSREAPTHGNESQPGVRLANWLSQGGAEAPPSLAEPADVAEPTRPPEPLPDDAVFPPSAQLPSGLDKTVSPEESLAEALPSSNPAAEEGSTDADHVPDTLRGIPVDTLHDPAAPTPPVTLDVASEARTTAPLGLAERLLSGDSAVRAATMHEVLGEPDQADRQPGGADRHTHPYGNPVTAAAAALVQEVVSAARTSPSQVPPPVEPERPSKEVDWGAWPTATAPDPRVTQIGRPSAGADATSPSKSTALPDATDLAVLEPSEGSSPEASARPASPSDADAPADLPTIAPDDIVPVPPEPAPKPDGAFPGEPTDAAPSSPRIALVPNAAADGEPLGPTSTVASQSATSAEALQALRESSQSGRLWLLLLAAFGLGVGGGIFVLSRRPTPPEAPPPVVATPEPAAAPTPTPPPPAPTPPAPAPAPAPAEAKPSKAPAAEPTGSPAVREALGPQTTDARQKCIDTNADGKGRAKAVVAACRPALGADPADAEIMVILARAEVDRGRFGEARSLAKKALAADPKRVEAYVYLGTAEQAAGKVDEARAAYKKYLELAPDGPFARELRAILSNL